MLTGDLLVTKISKGKIEPVYAQLSRANMEIASSLIDLFQGHVGKTYGELAEELEGLEEINYRLIRGHGWIGEYPGCRRPGDIAGKRGAEQSAAAITRGTSAAALKDGCRSTPKPSRSISPAAISCGPGRGIWSGTAI